MKMKTMPVKKNTFQVRRSNLNFIQPSFHKPASSVLKRSQLIENRAANTQEIFQNWLLRTGCSPKAGLPASQIGIYTDFQ